MKSLTESEVDVIKTAVAHLVTLRGNATPWTDEHRLRVASASLRLLLVDNILRRAWKASNIGGPILVRASFFKDNPDLNSVGFCGGADLLPGIPVSVSEIELENKLVDLSSFLRAPCIFIRGIRISRHELIKYVANTRGGSHYDETSRNPKFTLLRRLEDPNAPAMIVGLLLNDRNLVHHEIASIIQSVLRSDQTNGLIEFSDQLPS